MSDLYKNALIIATKGMCTPHVHLDENIIFRSTSWNNATTLIFSYGEVNKRYIFSQMVSFYQINFELMHVFYPKRNIFRQQSRLVRTRNRELSIQKRATNWIIHKINHFLSLLYGLR